MSVSVSGSLQGLSFLNLEGRPHSLALDFSPPPQVTLQGLQGCQGPSSGHLSVLQASSSVSGPKPHWLASTVSPVGRAHSLSLFLIPPPQVKEQSPHPLHSVQDGQGSSLHFLSS